MFPLSHLYVATEITKKRSPLLIFGSILPDISWTSQNKIDSNRIHYAPKKLYEYVSENCPKLLDLAIGVRLHSNVDKGADFYSDGENYSGFAYIEGMEIEPDVAKLLKDKPSLKSKVLSHNFIEAGTELNLLTDKPNMLHLYRKSISKLNFDDISIYLGKYLNLDTNIVQGEIDKFLQFIGPDSYVSEKIFAKKMTLLIKSRKGVIVESENVISVLEKAKGIMKNKYKNYLTEAIDHMKKDFSDLISK